MDKSAEEFKKIYFSLSMAIRSMSCQMIGVRCSVLTWEWGSEDTYNRYLGYHKELQIRKDRLVEDWLDEHPQNNRRWAWLILEQVKKEYSDLERLSALQTKEVYEEAKVHE